MLCGVVQNALFYAVLLNFTSFALNSNALTESVVGSSSVSNCTLYIMSNTMNTTCGLFGGINETTIKFSYSVINMNVHSQSGIGIISVWAISANISIVSCNIISSNISTNSSWFISGLGVNISI